MKIRIAKPLLKSLTLMASMIEARDAYTGGHLWRVSQYARRIAQTVGMAGEMVFLAELGGFLHDIGKIGIPDQILGKRGPLTRAEREVVKTHPGIGAELIQEHPLGALALAAVHQHHEWANGTGYPQGLHGPQTSVYARIVSLADAFDALTSTRPYRRGVTAAPALEALRQARSTQFDARLLDAFSPLIGREALEGVLGHTEWGIPLAVCPTCGPVVVVERETRDGDLGGCRVCGTRHRLHRRGDTFVVEPLNVKASARELRPQPARAAIEAFLAEAPSSVEIEG